MTPALEVRLARFQRPGLYVVITTEFCAGRNPVAILEACLDAGVRHVQCREKSATDRQYLDLARAFRERTREADAVLVIDDRVDIALAVDADGVHLGETDLPVADARRIAPDLIVGASAHSLDEAMEAQAAGAGYINIGPIFETQTKHVPTGAIGVEAFERILPRLTVPHTCMGGIKPHNVGELVSRGAERCAVVTAVTAADDPRRAAAELHARILSAPAH